MITKKVQAEHIKCSALACILNNIFEFYALEYIMVRHIINKGVSKSDGEVT